MDLCSRRNSALKAQLFYFTGESMQCLVENCPSPKTKVASKYDQSSLPLSNTNSLPSPQPLSLKLPSQLLFRRHSAHLRFIQSPFQRNQKVKIPVSLCPLSGFGPLYTVTLRFFQYLNPPFNILLPSFPSTLSKSSCEIEVLELGMK